MSAAMDDAVNAFIRTIRDAGDAYAKSGEYDSAVEAYKAAGNDGAMHLGPAIDEQMGGKTANLTQKAWQVNGELAGINSGPFNGTAATKTDSDRASTLVRQMFTLYCQALHPEKVRARRPGVWAPAPTLAPTEGAPAPSLLPLGAGAAAGAAIGFAIGNGPAALLGAVIGAVTGKLVTKGKG